MMTVAFSVRPKSFAKHFFLAIIQAAFLAPIVCAFFYLCIGSAAFWVYLYSPISIAGSMMAIIAFTITIRTDKLFASTYLASILLLLTGVALGEASTSTSLGVLHYLGFVLFFTFDLFFFYLCIEGEQWEKNES